MSWSPFLLILLAFCKQTLTFKAGPSRHSAPVPAVHQTHSIAPPSYASTQALQLSRRRSTSATSDTSSSDSSDHNPSPVHQGGRSRSTRSVSSRGSCSDPECSSVEGGTVRMRRVDSQGRNSQDETPESNNTGSRLSGIIKWARHKVGRSAPSPSSAPNNSSASPASQQQQQQSSSNTHSRSSRAAEDDAASYKSSTDDEEQTTVPEMVQSGNHLRSLAVVVENDAEKMAPTTVSPRQVHVTHVTPRSQTSFSPRNDRMEYRTPPPPSHEEIQEEEPVRESRV